MPNESNADMKLDVHEQRRGADANLQAVLDEIKGLLSPAEAALFDVLQERWREYRDALVAYERFQYEGGTNAALSAGIAAVRETDRWVKELHDLVRDRPR